MVVRMLKFFAALLSIFLISNIIILVQQNYLPDLSSKILYLSKIVLSGYHCIAIKLKVELFIKKKAVKLEKKSRNNFSEDGRMRRGRFPESVLWRLQRLRGFGIARDSRSRRFYRVDRRFGIEGALDPRRETTSSQKNGWAANRATHGVGRAVILPFTRVDPTVSATRFNKRHS